MGKAVPGKEPKAALSTVRRFEAAGFRAWPASAVHYDGTWVVRLTAGHPAKRLNSVNPLDPGDVQDLPERIIRAARRFDAYGREGEACRRDDGGAIRRIVQGGRSTWFCPRCQK